MCFFYKNKNCGLQYADAFHYDRVDPGTKRYSVWVRDDNTIDLVNVINTDATLIAQFGARATCDTAAQRADSSACLARAAL